MGQRWLCLHVYAVYIQIWSHPSQASLQRLWKGKSSRPDFWCLAFSRHYFFFWDFFFWVLTNDLPASFFFLTRSFEEVLNARNPGYTEPGWKVAGERQYLSISNRIWALVFIYSHCLHFGFVVPLSLSSLKRYMRDIGHTPLCVVYYIKWFIYLKG